jgi:hypothetical protein
MPVSDPGSLDIAFEVVKERHESIMSNVRSIDTKSSIFLALFGILLIPSLEILQWTIIINGLSFLKFIPIIFISVGMIVSLLTLLPQTYTIVPDLAALLGAVENNMGADTLKEQLFSNIHRAAIINSEIAAKKGRLINISAWLAIINFIIIAWLFLFKGVLDGR